MEIRTVRPSDFKSFHHCFESIVQEGGFFQFTKVPTKEKLKKFIDGLIKNDFTMLVSTDQVGDVIGWVELVPPRNQESSHNLELTIGVREDYRGKGLGKELFLKALESVDKLKYKFIRLEVLKSNALAIEFYRRNDFFEDGTIPKKYLINGNYFDAYFMTKDLN